MQKRRKSLFLNFINANLIVIVLIIGLVGTLLVYNLFVQLIGNVEQNQLLSMRRQADMLQERAVALQTAAVQISTDIKLLPSMFKKRSYSAIEAMDQLDMYFNSLKYGNMLCIYMKHNGNVYSNTGEMRFSSFTERIYTPSQGYTAQSVEEMLAGVDGLRLSPWDFSLRHTFSGESFCLWMVPLPPSKGASYGTLFVMMPVAEQARLLADISNELKCVAALVDREGNIRAIHDAMGGAEAALPLIERAQEGIARATLDGGAASVLCTEPSAFGLRIVMVFGHDQFIREMFSAHRTFWILVGGAVLVCLLLGVLLAYRNYNPIRKLERSIVQAAPSLGEQGGNELERILSTFGKAVERNRMLLRRLDIHRPILERDLIHSILTGDSSLDDEGFAARLHEAGLSWNTPYLCIAMIRLGGAHTAAQREDTIRLVHEIGDGSVSAGGTVLAESGAIALIINLREEKTEEAVRFCTALLMAAREFLALSMRIGISGIFTGRAEAGERLIEAAIALEMPQREDREIVIYQKPSKGDDPLSDITLLQTKLAQAVLYANEDAFAAASADIACALGQVKCQNQHLYAALHWETVMQVYRQLEAHDLPPGRQALISLTQSRSLEDTLREAACMLHEIQAGRQGEQEKRNARMKEAINGHFDAHYTDPDFSIAQLATTFSMSESKMSRLFSHLFGVNFQDYLSQRRLEAACTLLRDTDLKVRDIVRRVGYSDASNFTRKFTRDIGVTPVQYRQRHPHP